MTALIDPLLSEQLNFLPSLTEAELEALIAEVMTEVANILQADTVPEYWQDWLKTLFPNLFTVQFADHHFDFWEHVESIQPGIKPSAFFAIWGRGGAKTTSAEAAVVRLGARDARKFCLYIRSVQNKANESVQNIAAMLETSRLSAAYPLMGSRKMGKYGNSRGWRIDTLRCANDFSVVALGLDAAVRGIKIEEFRPDLIILDDIDDKRDSLEVIRKKIDILTTAILPAGSTDVAVIGIQNLMHPNSIFSQIAEDKADYLHDRIVSGPHPAVIDLEYESRPEGGYQITWGESTWAGQDLAVCENQLNEWGPTAFLQESQHEVEDPPGGIWDHIEFRHCDWADVPDLVAGCVWVDPAVTDKDESDAHGIQADGLGEDGFIYRLKSYEQRTSPEKSLKRAILWALELGFNTVGVETDQGGDTWESVYVQACLDIKNDDDLPQYHRGTTFPKLVQDKAGAGHGSKVHRNSVMLTDYEMGMVIHVRGTHHVLESGLRRFPRTKPFDLVDAAYYSWDWLRNEKYFGKVAKAR